MESVRTVFHAQLATVMDSLLAAAVCEIAKIFESSLCDQQAELVQRTQEISILRGKLERAERRQRPKSEGGEEREVSQGEGEDHLTAADQDVSPHTEPEGDRPTEETAGQDGSTIKRERAGSQTAVRSLTAQAPEGRLTIGDQRQLDTLSPTQVKVKLSHWDEGSHSADHHPLQEQASSPFLSISQSGRCSPRRDPSLDQPGNWVQGLDAARGGIPGLVGVQEHHTGCSGPDRTNAGADTPCFRPGFGSDETSNEDDDSSFPFLDQEPENQSSGLNLAQDQRSTEAQQDQPQVLSVVSPWRPREDRRGRDTVNQPRRAITFGNRDPLRPQSNPQSLSLRQANTLIHPPAPSGGNGRPYTCPYCSKCFTYPSHQRRHLLRHTGVRLHPCQFCDKRFLTPSELTVHTRTHTGERPFGCTQCGKRFARSGNLRAHQRDVHMGKRPFACTECGKRFAHRGNLRVHNHRVHQGDPYYMDNPQEPNTDPNS